MAKTLKTDPLELALAEIESNAKGEVIQIGRPRTMVDAMPTSLLSLDVALGIGGLPKGRIIEIFGPEASGKTTLTLQVIANCQKSGGVAAFIDAEHALDANWASNIGVDMNKLLFNQPSSGEKAFIIAQALAKHGAVDLIVIDSVAALVPQAEIDGEMTDAHIGIQARMMSKGLRKLVNINTKTCIMFINQVREKIGGFGGFGPQESTPGGRSLRHNTSVRMDIKRIGTIKAGDHSVGSEVRIKIAKNKVSPPFKTCDLQIFYGNPHQKSYEPNPIPFSGFDIPGSILDGATRIGSISVRGSNYYFGEVKIANGRDKTMAAIRQDDKLQAKIVEVTMQMLRGGATPIDDVPPEPERETEEDG